MIQFITTALISAVVTLTSAWGIYNYLPLAVLDNLPPVSQKVGSTITTIAGSDTISGSRTVINTNFSNLNTDKAEIASANAFTGANTFSALQQFTNASTSLSSCYGTCYFGATATSSFSRAGVLSLTSALSVGSGGTGSTTLAFGQVLLGSTTNAIGVVSGFGTTGQFLTSNGANTPPTWQTSAVDTAIAYNWTGNHSFSASTTFSAATTTFGGGVTFNQIVDGNITRLLQASTTNSGINNTNGSTTLATISVPANVLYYRGVNGVVRTKLNVSRFTQGSNQKFQLGITYGGANVCCIATTTASYEVTGGGGNIEVDLYGNGATNSQEVFIKSNLDVNAPTFRMLLPAVVDTIAVDSTSVQTLTIQANYPTSADPNNVITVTQVDSILYR